MGKMLTSFYFQTAQPAESANEKEDERTELDDEMWNSLQQDDDQEWATDPAEEILSTDTLLVKNEHEIWGDEEEALNDHEEADVPMEARVEKMEKMHRLRTERMEKRTKVREVNPRCDLASP